MTSLSRLLADIRACRLCAAELPLAPRPVLQARVLLAGQAPGRKAHESGLPFDDASGDRLRDWLGVTQEEFYDPARFAIVPMGFCFPGTGRSGDLPPRPECAPAWRDRLPARLPEVRLTVVLGRSAQLAHFEDTRQTVTELVRDWRRYWPEKLPLPHPSPRNTLWLRRNPCFEGEVLPALRALVAQAF
jgi:uracil-DNA glycosylase